MRHVHFHSLFQLAMDIFHFRAKNFSTVKDVHARVKRETYDTCHTSYTISAACTVYVCLSLYLNASLSSDFKAVDECIYVNLNAECRALVCRPRFSPASLFASLSKLSSILCSLIFISYSLLLASFSLAFELKKSESEMVKAIEWARRVHSECGIAMHVVFAQLSTEFKITVIHGIRSLFKRR